MVLNFRTGFSGIVHDCGLKTNSGRQCWSPVLLRERSRVADVQYACGTLPQASATA